MKEREETALLEVHNLKTHFFTANGVVPSVDGISFQLRSGEVTCIVGESGSGKSVTAYSIMGLIESPGKIVSGDIRLEGTDLTKLGIKQLRKIQGNEISMIFQEPLSSLNPLITVGFQIEEVIRLHQKVNKKEAKKRAIQMLSKVSIPIPDKVYNSYPFELSGGMRQRVMIAMALSCNPKLLIADEPTTALDVTIQAQILQLMKTLKEEFHTAVLMITHDLGVVAEMADRVIVMYAGQVVEEGDVFSLFGNPKHPYTKGLMKSTIKITDSKDELEIIPGTVPMPGSMPTGCRFQPRCEYAMPQCSVAPELRRFGELRQVRCWLHDEREVNEEHEFKERQAAVGGSRP